MGLNFFKKKNGVPDIGQEDAFDKDFKGSKTVKASGKTSESSGAPENTGSTSVTVAGKKPLKTSAGNESVNLEFSKVNARMEAVNSYVKALNEKLSVINQQIGEVRSMTLENEKSLSKSTKDSMKAVDIVKEVKPEKLRLDYQRQNLKLQALAEKFEVNRQYIVALTNEVKDLRRKSGIFIGTDGLLKLNEDVKKDLLEMQKLVSRVQLNADKTEQIFIESKKNSTESQKLGSSISNMESAQSGMQKEFQKLKLDYSKILKQDDFNSFKTNVNNRLLEIEKNFSKMDQIQQENDRLSNLIETILSVSKKNEDDIADIGVTIGDDRIKKVADYENQLASFLKIIDSVAGQIAGIKKKIGMKSDKIAVDNKKVISNDKLKLKNIQVHDNIAKNLVSKNPVSKNPVSKTLIGNNNLKRNIINKSESGSNKVVGKKNVVNEGKVVSGGLREESVNKGKSVEKHRKSIRKNHTKHKVRAARKKSRKSRKRK